MKKFYLLTAFGTCLLAYSQEKIVFPEQADLIEKNSTLTFGNGGAPVYFAVLRLNGKVLDVQPFPYLDGETGMHTAFKEKGYMLSGYVNFNLPKKAFTAEQIVELITKSKAKITDDDTLFLRVRKGIRKYNEPDVELPKFLTYTIEGTTVK